MKRREEEDGTHQASPLRLSFRCSDRHLRWNERRGLLQWSWKCRHRVDEDYRQRRSGRYVPGLRRMWEKEEGTGLRVVVDGVEEAGEDEDEEAD